MMKCLGISLVILASAASGSVPSVQLGSRPYWLIDEMREGPLKDELRK